MNAATLEREKQDVDNPTHMVHLTWDYKVALCGAKLRGVRHPRGSTECIVCTDLWATSA